MTLTTSASAGAATRQAVRLHVVFNNLPLRPGLTTGWGFACLIRTPETTVLFDTGGSGELLLDNMRRMNLDPDEVDLVVLSHSHGDHTGGLGAFLRRNPDVTVYMPAAFPPALQREASRLGARVETIGGPQRLTDRLSTTGEMDHGIKEQALVVDTAAGLIVITGCAHPNVAAMAEQARAFLGKDIHLLMGGFHLGGSSDARIRDIIGRLKALRVRKVAPSHCTGERAIGMFRAAWGDDFIDGGLGAVIELPAVQ